MNGPPSGREILPPLAVTKIEFRMIVDGRLVSATFDRPARITELLVEEKCSLGEWLRALRDSPEVPDIRKD